MRTLQDICARINIAGYLGFDEPMSRHTTFKVGGPADVYARPANRADLRFLRLFAIEQAIPTFIIGGGANIVVSDHGIRALIIDLSDIDYFKVDGTRVITGAGKPISDLSEVAAAAGLGGLDFLYSMPGSTGGAVWMNARCYGSSIVDVLTRVSYLDERGNLCEMDPKDYEFEYKQTPFQKNDWIIVEAEFTLIAEEETAVRARMVEYRQDRTKKGHFTWPCAGSLFKNNRNFGEPTGKLLDRLNMRETRVGGAMVSPLHANIIVNDGNATAHDILSLARIMENSARTELGYQLEREVLFVGEWREKEDP